MKQAKTVFFMRHHDGNEVRITIPTSGATLTDLCEAFTDFLRGCGYVFEGRAEIVVEENYETLGG